MEKARYPNNSRTTSTESPFRSPLSSFDSTSPSPSPAPPPPRPEATLPSIVTWSARVDHPPSSAGRADAAGSRSVAAIVRKEWSATAVNKAAIAVRVSSAVLCLISFSVMAADKRKGWTLDSFDRYKEYRYCLAVNVIGFAYAAFQAFAEVHHMIHKTYIINRPVGFYFDFAIDQILAYLLISASSSATSRTDYWVTNWGSDPFPNMVSGSVAISFLAFIAFAVSSLISAYNLFSH